MPAPTDLDELIRTHARLRDTMVLASARIKRQALGHQDFELLKSMREVLIEGRTVARKFEKGKSTPKVKGWQREEE
jgi:hypothetical protein